jgi:hypothetical protein
VWVQEIPDGEDGIRTTIAVMLDLIRRGAGHPTVRQWVDGITGGIPYPDERLTFETLLNSLRRVVVYRPDPAPTEYLLAPWYVLRCRVGATGGPVPLDCDDLTVLSLSVFAAAGLSTRVRVVSYEPSGEWGHVYGLVRVDGRWVPVDLAADALGRPAGSGAETRAEEYPVDPGAEETR